MTAVNQGVSPDENINPSLSSAGQQEVLNAEFPNQGLAQQERYTNFDQLHALSAERVQPFQHVAVNPEIFENNTTVDSSVRLEHLGRAFLSSKNEQALSADGSYFQASYGNQEMTAEGLFQTMRAPVDIHLPGKETPVQGLPLFGALDTDNVNPILRGMAFGAKESIVVNTDVNTPVNCIDLGMGWGSTAAFQVEVIHSAIEHLKSKNAEIPQITLHLVDPRFDANFRRLSEKSDVFEFVDYHPNNTEPLKISDFSEGYQPKKVDFGYFFTKQLESNPSLLQTLEEAGAKIIFHRGYSDEFFESNKQKLSSEKVGTVVIDDEHKTSTNLQGDTQLQPITNILNSLDISPNIIILDDRKASKPCCGVQVAIDTLAKGSIDYNSEAYKVLAQDAPQYITNEQYFRDWNVDDSGLPGKLKSAEELAQQRINNLNKIISPALTEQAASSLESYSVVTTHNSRTAFFVKQ